MVDILRRVGLLGPPTIEAPEGPVRRRAFGADENFVVGRTSEGRPIVSTPAGDLFSERSATVTDPRLNEGRPTNIPTVFSGVQEDIGTATDIAAQGGGVDIETGRSLPGFASVPQAVSAAQTRSASIRDELGRIPGQPTVIEIEGLGEIEFPFGMSPEEIQRALDSDPNIQSAYLDATQGRLGAAGRAFAQGATDVIASIPQAMGISRSAGAKTLLQEFARIDRGLPYDPGRVSPTIAGQVFAYSQATPEQRGELRAQIEAQTDPREGPLFQAGKVMSEAVEEALPVAPSRQRQFTTQVARGGGSTVGFAVAEVLGRLGGLPPGVSAGLGSAAQASAQFDDAVQAGADLETATEAAGLGAVLGTAEALPIINLLNRLDRRTGGNVKRWLSNILKQGTEEAIQEAFQSIGENLIASDLVAYDPQRRAFEGTGEAAGVGFTVGGLMQVIFGLLTLGRARGPSKSIEERDLASPLEAPQPESAPTPETAQTPPPPETEPTVPPPPLEPEPVSRGTPSDAERQAASLGEALERVDQGEDINDVLRDQQRAEAPAGTADKPVDVQTVADTDQAASQAEQPSPAQAQAGNYRKGHLTYRGIDIALETPRGEPRTGVDEDGQPWESRHPTAHYGYIKRTEGADGDQVDVYIGLDVQSDRVFIVDQVDPRTSEFDEHKAIIGASTLADAEFIYDAGFADQSGPQRRQAISEMSVTQFRQWLRDGDTQAAVDRTAEERQRLEARDRLIGQLRSVIADRNAGSIRPAVIAERFEVAEDLAREALESLAARGEGIRRTQSGEFRREPRRIMDAVQYLAAFGGIRDDRGELRALDAQNRFVPGIGPLVRPAGMSLDDAGLALHQAGFFGPPATAERPTVAQVLDVISDTLAGNRRFSEFDVEELATRRENARNQEASAQHRQLQMQIREEANRLNERFEATEIEFMADQLMENPDLGPIDVISDMAERLAISAAEDFEAETGQILERQQEGIDDQSTVRQPDLGDAASPAVAGSLEPAEETGQAGQEPVGEDQPPAGPAVEPTDQGQQAVIPGAEAISDRELAERQAQAPATSEVAQQPPDEGLFDTAARGQGDLVDLAAQQPEGRVQARRQPSRGTTTQTGLTGARARSEAGVAASEKLPSPVRIKTILDRLLGLIPVANRQGRLQPGNLGQFDTGQGVIRRQVMNELDVFAHEFGHAFDQVYGPRGLEAVLKAHSAQVEAFAYAGTPKGQELSEGFGEWFRLYITNPEYVRKESAEFTKAFEDWLVLIDREAFDLFAEIQQAWDAYLAAPSGESVKEHVLRPSDSRGLKGVFRQIRENGIGAWFQQRGNRLYTKLIDDLHPIHVAVQHLMAEHEKKLERPQELKMADNAYVMARLSRDAWSAGHVDIMNGVVPYHEINPEGPSLFDSMITALGDQFTSWSQEALDDFSSYLISRRAVHEWDNFNEGLIPNRPTQETKGDHEVNIRELEQRYPSFRKAAQQVNDFANNLWKKRWEAGFIDEQRYRAGLERHPFYVPFKRDVSDKTSIMPTPPAVGIKGAAKAFRGSQRDILDPIEVLMQEAYALSMDIARNDTVGALVKLARVAGPNAGRVIEQIPAKEIKVTLVDPKEALKASTQSSDWDGLDDRDQVAIEAALSALDDIEVPTARIFRAVDMNPGSEPIVYHYEDGRRVPYRLADGEFGIDLYNAIRNLDKDQSNMFINLLSLPAFWLRSGITTEPSFFAANFVRDQVAAWILTDVGFKPGWSAAEGLIQDLTQSEVARIYNQTGGIMGGANVASLDRARIKKDVQALRQRGIRIRRFFGVRGFGQFTELSETGTRLGIFDNARKRAKARGLNDFESAIEGAFLARDYIDFGRHGSRMIAARRIFTFMNAGLQALDKSVRVLSGAGSLQRALRPYMKHYANASGGQVELSERDKRNLRLSAKAWSKMALIGVMGLSLTMMYADDPEYEEISEYLRATHWIIKAGGEWIAIPKPFELAMISNFLERGYEHFYKDDPGSLDRLWRGLLMTVLPPFNAPALSVPIEVFANRRFFDNRPIVPEFLLDLEPWAQYTEYNSTLGIWLGRQFNISPAIIDHYVTGWLGSWGRILLQAFTSANPDAAEEGLADTFFLRRFVREIARGAVSSQEFWAQMDREGNGLYSRYATYRHLAENTDKGSAVDYLKKLEPWERAYAVFRKNAQRGFRIAHPMERSMDAIRKIAALRREIRKAPVSEFTPRQKRFLDDNLQRLALAEARNSLIWAGVPEWRNKDPLDITTITDQINQIDGQVFRDLKKSYASKRLVLGDENVKATWERTRDRQLSIANEIMAGKREP